MIRFDQWALPDGEAHLQGWMQKVNKRVEGRLTYQYHKYTKALSYCAQRRVAVDVGAHVGLMSFWMAHDFAAVHAFEPVAAHRECFVENVQASNVTLHPVALGDECKGVSIYTAPTSSGDSYPDGAGDIPMVLLDSFELQGVDFLKADAEGFELFIMRGARDTIERCKPVIMCEQKTAKAPKFGLGETDAVTYLQGLGYRVAEILSGDFIMLPDVKAAA